jgi:hypothetical protein
MLHPLSHNPACRRDYKARHTQQTQPENAIDPEDAFEIPVPWQS